MDSAYHIIVSGRVQGVGFRYSTQKQAYRYRLTGFVRNMRDGSVEILCEGDEEKINSFLNWVKVGPPGARVSDSKIRKIPRKGTYPRFSVEY